MPKTPIRGGVAGPVGAALLAACLATNAYSAGREPLKQATPAEAAAFWTKVFTGPKPYGVPPLNAERANQRREGNVKLWDVRFDSYRDPDTNEPARLAGIYGVPDRPGNKFPGLVVTHSVGAAYPAPDNVADMAKFFAGRGYAVLAFYTRGYGTSRMAKINIDNPRGPVDGFYCANLVDNGQEPLDTVWAGFPVDMYQAGEFLAAQPEVSDPHALAVIGHSLGGYDALMAGIFNKRFKVIVASAPAAVSSDLDQWMVKWKNSPWRRWADKQPDPGLAMERAVRTWSYTGVYRAINNPEMVARNPRWKLDNTAVWFYGGANDPAIPAADVEAAWRLADDSNQKVLHISPSGGHGGPESWVPAQAWLAGHYPGQPRRKPVADLKIVTQRGGAVILSAEGSSDPLGLVSWEYDLGDGTRRNWGTTIGHTYQRPGRYTAKLTVTNGAGLRDTATVVVTVKSVSQASQEAAAAPGHGTRPVSAVPVRIEAGQATGVPGGAISVPIVITGPEDGAVTSFAISLTFDHKVLVQPRAARGPAVPGPAWWNFASHPSAPGSYVISAEQFVPSPSPVLNGVVGYAVFSVPLTAAPGLYPLAIVKAEINNGAIAAKMQSGTVRIEASQP